MPHIVFVRPDGKERAVDARPGVTVMEAAVQNGVDGILAECGGSCACATCHVIVDPDWMSVVGLPDPIEADMLDFAAEVTENSRLSCQIRLTDKMDGLRLRLPTSQG
jgi:ferredoxin, 2Fe-2S